MTEILKNVIKYKIQLIITIINRTRDKYYPRIYKKSIKFQLSNYQQPSVTEQIR